jgi:hypothetical protein
MAKCKHYWVGYVEKDGTKVKWCMFCQAKK